MKRILFSIVIAAACHGVPTHAQERENSAGELEQGKHVYENWCAPCHGPGLGLPGFGGQAGVGGLPGTQQLGIKYRGTDVPAVLDERTDLVPEFIEVIVRQGVSFMPQFRKTEVSDADLKALSAYLTRNNPKSQ
jgi:mono/diheme cytochrome c family protein